MPTVFLDIRTIPLEKMINAAALHHEKEFSFLDLCTSEGTSWAYEIYKLVQEAL